MQLEPPYEATLTILAVDKTAGITMKVKCCCGYEATETVNPMVGDPDTYQKHMEVCPRAEPLRKAIW